jgi:NADH dehydrogenase
VVRLLREQGAEVRALARPATDAGALEATGARVVRGDLRDPRGFDAIVDGVHTVVATANMIVPRRGERADFDALADGYVELGRACRRAGVRRFVLLSVPVSFMGRGAPDFDAKQRVEAELRAQGVPLTVARSSVFMDTWLPALGSRLALRGAEQATVDRGFWLIRLTGLAHGSIERFGVAFVPGSGKARHSFVAADDVAGSLAAAASSEGAPGEELLLGGPEALSWRDVLTVFERRLGRRVRRVRQPAVPLRVLSLALRAASPAASHLLAAQYLIATRDSVYPPDAARRLLGRDPVSVEEFLRSRIALA